MCAARLPGSGPIRRTVSQGSQLAALAPRLPPEQCRRYDVRTQLLLEAKA